MKKYIFIVFILACLVSFLTMNNIQTPGNVYSESTYEIGYIIGNIFLYMILIGLLGSPFFLIFTKARKEENDKKDKPK